MIMCKCGDVLNHYGSCDFVTTGSRSYAHIRPQIREALDQWAEQGRPVGHFLTAVLSNDLFRAIGYADDENLSAISAIVAYVYNELPSGCWGSPRKVESWKEDHPPGRNT
jgi:hypothetical protein